MTFKYQETFAEDLALSWAKGNHSNVRSIIRNLKNKAQAAYIALKVASYLVGFEYEEHENGTSVSYVQEFIEFMHPNNA